MNLGAAAPLMPYIVVLGILVLTGFGMPFPEDIPIIVGGYLSAQGYCDAWIMFPAIFITILGSDGIVFFLGRRFGHHVPRLPIFRRYLTEARLSKTEALLHAHGGKFMFASRFLPGFRTPAMFTAGSFKVPYWRFLLYDGSAAAISVPTIFWLTYAFADHIERAKEWITSGQYTAMIVMAAAVIAFIAVKVILHRRAARVEQRT